jgi:hypothetical protein
LISLLLVPVLKTAWWEGEMQIGIAKFRAGQVNAVSRRTSQQRVERCDSKTCIALSQGQVHSLTGFPGLKLHVHEGRVWITIAGNARDFIVEAGQDITFQRSGGVLVQAISGEAELSSDCDGEYGVASLLASLLASFSQRLRYRREHKNT